MTMYLARHGSGERVFVGLHGWSGDHTTFAPLAQFVPSDATLYSADLPGHGLSPAPREWRLDELAGAVARAVAQIGAPRVTLVGSCSGGLFALFAAQRLGERVERVVLIDPFAYFPWYFKLFVAPQLGRVGRYAYYSTFANPLGRWLTNQSLRRQRPAGTDLTRSFAQVNHAVTYAYLKVLAEEGGHPGQFRSLRARVDLAYGERTFAAVKDSVGQWRQVWPESRCWELAGAGHLPIEETPAQLSRLIFAAGPTGDAAGRSTGNG